MTGFRVSWLLPALFAVCLGGCSTCRVQLWANSDSDNPKNYTMRNPHYVYAGETVDFRVVTQPDTASYVVAAYDGRHELLKRVGEGEYAFSQLFDESRRDRNCDIEVHAYRRSGQQDFYLEDDRVLKRTGTGDPADQELGLARMKLVCYRCTITFNVATKKGEEPDWSKAELRLYGPDDKVSCVRRGRPGFDGFTPLGCDAWGGWAVFYEPRFDEVCRAGRTRIVFTVPDPATQQEIRKEFWVNTP